MLSYTNINARFTQYYVALPCRTLPLCRVAMIESISILAAGCGAAQRDVAMRYIVNLALLYSILRWCCRLMLIMTYSTHRLGRRYTTEVPSGGLLKRDWYHLNTWSRLDWGEGQVEKRTSLTTSSGEWSRYITCQTKISFPLGQDHF